MTRAKWAFGTQLKKSGVAIAQLTNINGLELDSDELDVTSHDSPGGYEEIIQTVRRTGTVSIEGNFYPGDAGQAALMADYLTGEVGHYTIEFPVELAAGWSFDAFVKKPIATEAPFDGKVGFTAELRVTGQPSLDVGYTDDLTDLELSVGTLAPEFDGAVYEYATSMVTGTTVFKLTVTGAGVLTYDYSNDTGADEGVTLTTAVQSGNIPLSSAGGVTVLTVHAKATNKIEKTYRILIIREAA